MERVRAGLRIPYDLNTWLIKTADEQGISKNALILQILWDRVGKQNTREGQPCGKREDFVKSSDEVQ